MLKSIKISLQLAVICNAIRQVKSPFKTFKYLFKSILITADIIIILKHIKMKEKCTRYSDKTINKNIQLEVFFNSVKDFDFS